MSHRDLPSEGENAGLPMVLDPTTRWNLEELGLTLKPAKTTTETIVVDHIELPSAN
jgi:uncharacterized protein (TIGR03435 family)